METRWLRVQLLLRGINYINFLSRKKRRAALSSATLYTIVRCVRNKVSQHYDVWNGKKLTFGTSIYWAMLQSSSSIRYRTSSTISCSLSSWCSTKVFIAFSRLAFIWEHKNLKWLRKNMYRHDAMNIIWL